MDEKENEYIDDELEDVIDVVTVDPISKDVIPHEKCDVVTVNTNPDSEELEKDAKEDYNYVRKNYKEIIEMGKEALIGLSAVAEASDHPRHYEVLATLIKNVTESNEKLMNLHQQKRELTQNKEETNNTTNNNLILTTNDLLKLISGNKK